MHVFFYAFMCISNSSLTFPCHFKDRLGLSEERREEKGTKEVLVDGHRTISLLEGLFRVRGAGRQRFIEKEIGPVSGGAEGLCTPPPLTT